MRKILLLSLLFVVIQTFTENILYSQDGETIRIAFWNLENFFDPFVDSTRTYNEFTENGSQHWTLSRFYKKRNNIYKAILALSDGEPIGILGLCEIENSFVANMIFQDTPLKKHNYRLIHYEGEDRRGIDVAMVYSIDKLQLIESKAIKIRSPDGGLIKTRDILYAKFYDRKSDTLHCFVNHWTSRYGGEKETLRLRALNAHILRNNIDSLIRVNGCIPKIVIIGDFNDTPYDNSILNVLRAKPYKSFSKNDTLINLFSDNKDLGFDGTIKHQYQWQIFDQMIISKTLYNSSKCLIYIKKSASIFHQDFLFIDDNTYGGKKLFRTYIGPKYQGGYSDHLPIYIDLLRRDN